MELKEDLYFKTYLDLFGKKSNLDQTKEFLSELCLKVHNVNNQIKLFNQENIVEYDKKLHEDSTLNSIKAVLKDPDITPKEQHTIWKLNKIKNGYVYGEIKDDIKKTHPCLVDYEQLPQLERLKDLAFREAVRHFVETRFGNKFTFSSDFINLTPENLLPNLTKVIQDQDLNLEKTISTSISEEIDLELSTNNNITQRKSFKI